jgi:nucleoside-diphosphate-sugar epimerase
VAVLGAAGFIGRWVTRALTQSGASLSLLVRDRTVAGEIFSRYGIHGEICSIDLNDSSALYAAYRDIRPAVTFNLAAYGVYPWQREETQAIQINTELVKTLCQVVSEVRDPDWEHQVLVQAGSALEYGEIGGDLVESSIPNPTTLYGRSKLAGTHILAESCQELGIRGLTARLFTVYGPGEKPGRLLPSLIDAVKTEATLPMTAGLQKRDFSYVEEAAEGLLRLGLSPAGTGEIVNLACGELTPVRRFAETAAQILSLPPERLSFGALPTRAEEMEHAPVAIGRLRQLTGWSPSADLREGIRKTIDFERTMSPVQVIQE